jgi:hypothetical protein
MSHCDYTLVNELSSWAVALLCPHCERTGSCTVSEDADDGAKELGLRIDALSSGFVVVELRARAGRDIRCATCNSSALKAVESQRTPHDEKCPGQFWRLTRARF